MLKGINLDADFNGMDNRDTTYSVKYSSSEFFHMARCLPERL